MKRFPKAKIYEAFSALGDKRIKLLDENHAIVISSNFKKEYQLVWNNKEISSTDNATFWQGYPGYPVIAIWILKNVVTVSEEIFSLFKGINWNQLNEKYKRDYDEAINEVLEELGSEERNKIETIVDEIYEEIMGLDWKIVRKVEI